uniref:Uncharacterized protein n=1 Tax=Vitis vinifera TaxID=29760 RepID=F6H9R3_VITVI
MEESGQVPVQVCPGKGYNECDYVKMVESGPVPGSGRICASTEKRTRRVAKKLAISGNTEKVVESRSEPGSGRIPVRTGIG